MQNLRVSHVSGRRIRLLFQAHGALPREQPQRSPSRDTGLHLQKGPLGIVRTAVRRMQRTSQVSRKRRAREREAQEKKAKKAADKVALKQDPGKERTKPRHDKSDKKKDKKDEKEE